MRVSLTLVKPPANPLTFPLSTVGFASETGAFFPVDLSGDFTVAFFSVFFAMIGRLGDCLGFLAGMTDSVTALAQLQAQNSASMKI